MQAKQLEATVVSLRAELSKAQDAIEAERVKQQALVLTNMAQTEQLQGGRAGS